MTEQELKDLKDPGRLHLMAVAQEVFGKEFVNKQLPKPCYRLVAGGIIGAYRSEKHWKTAWMVLAIVQAIVQIAMMIGG